MNDEFTGMPHGGDFAAQLEAENYSPPMNPVPIPEDGDPVAFLIDRVTRVVAESAQMGTEPLTTIASVLAQLYQAQALREIADEFGEITALLSSLIRASNFKALAPKGAKGRNADDEWIGTNEDDTDG